MKNTFSSVFGCFGRNKRKRIALIQVEYNYKIQNPASEKKKNSSRDLRHTISSW